MVYLRQVKYKLPNKNKQLVDTFLSLLDRLGNRRGSQITLNLSQSDFLPETIFEFSEVTTPSVVFNYDGTEHIVEIKNSTGVTKQSPHRYSAIEIDDFVGRLAAIKLVGIDHTGFNLPYFEGTHPEILKLRELLKDRCLYHEFPKNLADEPWDFILPATQDEITGKE